MARVFSGWGVFSHVAAQHPAKRCKCHELCCLPGAECRWKPLCSGARTWHTHKLCYFCANFHRTAEWKPSFRKSPSAVTAVCNIQRGRHRIIALVGLGRSRSLREMAWAKGQPVLPPPCSPICLLLERAVLLLLSLISACAYMKQWSLQGKLCSGEEWKKYSGESWSLTITVVSLVFGKRRIASNARAPVESLFLFLTEILPWVLWWCSAWVSVNKRIPPCLPVSADQRRYLWLWLDQVTVFSVSPAAGACVRVLACGTGKGNGIAFAHYRIHQISSVLSEEKSTHVNHCHPSADMQ